MDEAYSTEARVIHLRRMLQGLEQAEKVLLKILAENKGEMTSKKLYTEFEERTGHKSKKYNAIVKKLEVLRLVDAPYIHKVGRSRRVILRHEEEDIIHHLK